MEGVKSPLQLLVLSFIVISGGISQLNCYANPVQKRSEGEVWCPRLPCPFPGTCDNPRQTWFKYHGRECPGCTYCNQQTIQKGRSVASNEYVRPVGCPMFKCLAPQCSPDRYMWNYERIDGLICRTCPECSSL